MIHIPFNRPCQTGSESSFVLQALHSNHLSGDGSFAKKCQGWFQDRLPHGTRALLTSSCTHALEMAAILANFGPGDEVIMPSFTFTSTANAFALRGASIRFVDIRPDTLNLDESKIEAAITSKTKAIVPVHYGGVACEMNAINAIAKAHRLLVIEDAAQGVMATYEGRPLGALADIGTYSFHETKNITAGGEGGLLLTNRPEHEKRAEILREKGTNRSEFFRGMVDKYTWVDVGSSYLASELQAAYLFAQLERAEEITRNRMATWNRYCEQLDHLKQREVLELPFIPKSCQHNGHIFYIKLKNLEIRTKLIEFLKTSNIHPAFHYVPLHSSPAGKKFGEFVGEDVNTSCEAARVLRLPIYFGLAKDEVDFVCDRISAFFIKN